jgi:AraC-like DNA-binding protein
MARAGQSAAATDCQLSPFARMHYWKPAPPLAGLISGYHLYAVQTPPRRLHRDVFQPAWFNLRILLTPATRWCVSVGQGPEQKLTGAVLFGPSSKIAWSRSDSGIVVGVGLTPLGWSRLAAGDAASWANKIGPAQAAFGPGIEALAELACAISDDAELPRLFDAFMLGALAHPSPLERTVSRMSEGLLDPDIASVQTLAAHVGLSPRSLERIAARAFGFAPKLLLRRARFLRSLHAIAGADHSCRAASIDPAYTDYSHFARDAQSFLGMAPGRFLALDTPLLDQSLRLRRAVLGAPAQALANAARPQ